MKKHSFLLWLIVALTLAVVAGCSDDTSNDKEEKPEGDSAVEEEAKGGHVIVASAAYVDSFDPIGSISGADYSFFYPVYENLVGLDKDLQLMPELAESWDTPDDKTIVFNLKENVKFHDGTPFDAEAVKFNLERVNSEKSVIKDLENIESIEVIDPVTVQINLKEMDSSILTMFADRGGAMLSPTAVEKYGDDYHSNPVGTGPFKVVKTVTDQEVQYEAFEDYWDEGKPYLDQLTLKVMPDENTQINALKSGQVHFIGVSPANVKVFENDPNFRVEVGKPTVGNRLYINTALAPLDNQKVRQAISYSLNREEINQALTLGYGEVAGQIFPKDNWAYNDEIQPEYDQDKAKQLLEESGLNNIEIDIAHFTVGDFPQLAEITASQLAEVGIKANLHPMEVNAAIAGFGEGDFHTFIANWGVASDPKSTINALYRGHAALNPGNETAPGLEELYQAALQTYDQDERAELYKEIVTIAHDFGYMAHYQFVPVILVMSNDIEGFDSNYMGDFSKLKIKK